MSRPPVSTEQADRKVEHTIWPCVPHSPETPCVVAQEAYMRNKNVLKPARKAPNGSNPR